jgi:hypothetical protein
LTNALLELRTLSLARFKSLAAALYSSTLAALPASLLTVCWELSRIVIARSQRFSISLMCGGIFAQLLNWFNLVVTVRIAGLFQKTMFYAC